MLVTLPYEMPELVASAPLDIHRSTVLPEWLDWNGHMNVAFYVLALDQASGAARPTGVTRSYEEVTKPLSATALPNRERRAWRGPGAASARPRASRCALRAWPSRPS